MQENSVKLCGELNSNRTMSKKGLGIREIMHYNGILSDSKNASKYMSLMSHFKSPKRFHSCCT